MVEFWRGTGGVTTCYDVTRVNRPSRAAPSPRRRNAVRWEPHNRTVLLPVARTRGGSAVILLFYFLRSIARSLAAPLTQIRREHVLAGCGGGFVGTSPRKSTPAGAVSETCASENERACQCLFTSPRSGFGSAQYSAGIFERPVPALVGRFRRETSTRDRRGNPSCPLRPVRTSPSNMKRRWSGVQVVRISPEESSSEVTSSSATLVMSPANSLASTDIGEVDLVEFWDLDLNSQNNARGAVVMQNGYGVPGHTVISATHPKSDTSSISGNVALNLECVRGKRVGRDLGSGMSRFVPFSAVLCFALLIHLMTSFQNEQIRRHNIASTFQPRQV